MLVQNTISELIFFAPRLKRLCILLAFSCIFFGVCTTTHAQSGSWQATTSTTQAYGQPLGSWNPTISYSWVPAKGTNSSPPNPSFWLISAYMYAYGGTGSISPYGVTLPQTNPGFQPYGINQLVQAGASGTASFTEQFTASGNFMGAGFSVAPDSRGAMITSSIDPTYHKAADGSRQSDTRGSDGTLNANSVIPTAPPNGNQGTGGESITFTGAPLGGWAQGSYGNLNLALTGGNTQGYFSGTGTTWTLEGQYYTPGAGGPGTANPTVGTKEHAHLDLTDPNGAHATTDYYVIFNAPASNFVHLSDTPQSPVCVGSGGAFMNNTDGVITQSNSSVNWQLQGNSGSGITSVGTALYSLTAEANPAIIALLSAAGWALTQNDPPATIQYSVEGSGSLGQFEQDVATQTAINSGQPGVFVPSVNRILNINPLTISASGNYSAYWGGASYVEQVWRPVTQSNFSNDTYDIHGYAGPGQSSVTWPGTPQAVNSWTPHAPN